LPRLQACKVLTSLMGEKLSEHSVNECQNQN
jgi:hypothetical protein